MSENLTVILFLLVCFLPILYQLVVVIREHKKERKLALKRLKRIVKYSLIIFIPIALSIGILSHTNYLDYERPMTYDKFDQITFENFRGIELFKKSLYGSKEFAYVRTSIDLNFDKNAVTIQLLFYPSRSFVYNKYSNSKELLSHEKYHIKITELYARIAREKVAKLEVLSKNEIKDIIHVVKKDEREFQERYDYDTFHSYVFKEQKKYEREIDSLLSLLADFKNSTIKFNENEKD